MVILGIIIKASKTPVEKSRICNDELIFKPFQDVSDACVNVEPITNTSVFVTEGNSPFVFASGDNPNGRIKSLGMFFTILGQVCLLLFLLLLVFTIYCYYSFSLAVFTSTEKSSLSNMIFIP